MTKQKSEVDLEVRNAIVLRATPTASIRALAEKATAAGGVVQFFDPAAVASRLHLFGAYANAVSAISCGTNRSKSAAMEMLLFTAMTRQIKGAVELVGAKADSDILIFAENRKSLGTISSHIRNVREFSPDPGHRKRALKLLGLPETTTDIELLQAMAVCMLRY